MRKLGTRLFFNLSLFSLFCFFFFFSSSSYCGKTALKTVNPSACKTALQPEFPALIRETRIDWPGTYYLLLLRQVSSTCQLDCALTSRKLELLCRFPSRNDLLCSEESLLRNCFCVLLLLVCEVSSPWKKEQNDDQISKGCILKFMKAAQVPPT